VHSLQGRYETGPWGRYASEVGARGRETFEVIVMTVHTTAIVVSNILIHELLRERICRAEIILLVPGSITYSSTNIKHAVLFTQDLRTI
jgi:hypothetical protein